MARIEPIIGALNRSGVRYVLVGGVAVVLHGYARLTVDVDVVVDLIPEEARKVVQALVEEGFRPSVPVDPLDFADASIRRRWIEEKGMRVFPMHDPRDPLRRVDLFVESPIDFEVLWGRSKLVELEGDSVRIAAIPDLITMKRLAARGQDLLDVEALEAILERGADDE